MDLLDLLYLYCGRIHWLDLLDRSLLILNLLDILNLLHWNFCLDLIRIDVLNRSSLIHLDWCFDHLLQLLGWESLVLDLLLSFDRHILNLKWLCV